MKGISITLLLVLAVLVSTATAHYGDPNDGGCEKDEQPVKIQGLAGDFCSPPCDSSGNCPTDVPPGVTAKPECALSSSSGAKYCALVCNPSTEVFDNVCGKNATCKSIQGSGICTYNDVPVPPSSTHWVPVPSPWFQEQTSVIDVGFTKDGKTGWAGAGENGVGAVIIKTEDSGITWKPLPGNASFNIYLASAVKNEKEGVISGALFQAYTTDGDSFTNSENLFLSPAQDAGIIPGKDGLYAIPTAGEKFSGIATSTDGKKWEQKGDLKLNLTTYLARYGSYPSECTWYVNSGTFPESNSDETSKSSSFKMLNKHVGINKKTSKMEFSYKKRQNNGGDKPVNCNVDASNCFSAAISKTTDCGKTWELVYNNINKGDNIYPNGIHCISDDHCVAVVEGDTCRILLTTDGGKSWSESMHDTDSACSLVSVRMLSEKEIWVSGGHMTYADFEGRFWHSLDGGKTFTKEAIKGLYIFSFDMTSAASGYSVALTESSGVQLLKYRASKQDEATATTKTMFVGANKKQVSSVNKGWFDLFTPPFFQDCPISLLTGISCASTKECFVSGGPPDNSMSVYRSYDEHFRNTERETVNESLPIDMLLTMATESATSSLVGGVGLGVGGTWHSNDGKTYVQSKHEFGVLQTQAAYSLGKGHYAFVGQGAEKLGKDGGVGYSTDGGVSFASFDVLDSLKVPMGAFARYGSFPSPTTWYVTGGAWPGVSKQRDIGSDLFYLTQSLRMNRKTKKLELVKKSPKLNNKENIHGDEGGYSAVIAKTTDGGKTWELQFNDTGRFYFNEIDCASEDVCIAVAEGYSQDGSTDPGAHILKTTDGGKKWNEIYTFGASTGGGGMDVKMLSEMEAWVAVSDSTGGHILHTTDGGKTFTEGAALKGIGAVMQMSFINPTTAYAAAITTAQDSTVLAMGISPPPPGPAPVPADAFEQKQCSDTNCSVGCREGKFEQGKCLQTTGGGSATVACSKDGKSLVQSMYQSADCSGTAKKSSEPTMQCLKSNSGGYFENICPQPKMKTKKLSGPFVFETLEKLMV